MIKNEEGYADPTYGGVYKTIRQEEKRKQDEADAARMDKAIHKARAIFKAYGFGRQNIFGFKAWRQRCDQRSMPYGNKLFQRHIHCRCYERNA